MKIRTKKYKLPTSTYVGIGFRGVLRQQWWVFLIFLGLCSCYFWIPNLWWISGAVIGLLLYMIFWLIQFAGVTKLEQSKFMFEKLTYEITSQEILIKINAKQGMPLKWDQIKRVQIRKNDFILFVSKAQIIHLPFKIFNNNNDITFLKTVLKRKGYMK